MPQLLVHPEIIQRFDFIKATLILKAQLYMSFAFLGGDILAEQALAYRHLTGIATLKSCEESAFYYLRVAASCSINQETMYFFLMTKFALFVVYLYTFDSRPCT